MNRVRVQRRAPTFQQRKRIAVPATIKSKKKKSSRNSTKSSSRTASPPGSLKISPKLRGQSRSLSPFITSKTNTNSDSLFSTESLVCQEEPSLEQFLESAPVLPRFRDTQITSSLTRSNSSEVSYTMLNSLAIVDAGHIAELTSCVCCDMQFI
ncbi:hypothetical protein PCE1_003099 [Barthelona sp. PCE]